ncbi:hemolysin family protein [Nocardioides panacisoli]|uniref:hemolysin family protein n=1 Tax=Nocardioides panacisoli TaxID=627624 RepID=UPI001C62844F|nr:hemolysin family protein [Nocardioides panacisoli]QYJ05123.1 hemolysin family protein [Nocardioides panacisoli]
MSSTVALAVAVLLLAANAFFVGAEFALISARRSQIEPRAEAGSRGARTTLRAMEQVSQMMAGAQLGITVCSLGLGAVGEPAVAHLIEPGLDALGVPHGLVHPIAFAIALVIVVCLHVVLGEMVPKNIAIAGPDRAALVLGPAMFTIVTVLRPVIVTINALANGILRLLGIEPKDEVSSSFTRQEVAALVEESHGEGLIAEDEYDRLSGALTFTEKTVEAVTIAPEDLATLPRGATLREVEDLCAATGFSRFPILDGGKLIGYLHIKDVLEDDPRQRARPVTDRGVRPFASVRLDTPLHEVLEVLQRRGAHLARVVDDAGTTVGVAALEDVIEELVGEIRDAAHSADT